MSNAQDEWTPLHAAAKIGNVTIVNILIKAGADVGVVMVSLCVFN